MVKTENPVSLSDLGLIRYRVMTLGQTDRETDSIPIANTRSTVPAGTAVTCKKNCPKLMLVSLS